MREIPYGHQSVSWLDALRVARATKSQWMTTGPAVDKFENDIARLSGAEHAVAVSSGSAALHCAYASIDLSPGDEVITSPLTFASTATTALNLGARVVFADIQPDTGNLDPARVEALITSRTKAVVAVDYAGHPADLDELLEITRKRGITLIQDAAHSLGSTYKNRPVGSIADITTFSFFPTKNISTGEGGAVLTQDSNLDLKARLFRSHGLLRNRQALRYGNEGPWHQEIHSLGLNYRLPDLLASLGSSQLLRLEKFKRARRAVFSRYTDSLGGVDGLQLPTERSYVNSMWHLFPVRVRAESRKGIFEALRRKGVLVQVNYVPVYWHPYFEDLGARRGLCPVAEDFYRREISLPMFAGLRNAEQRRVTKAVMALLKEGSE